MNSVFSQRLKELREERGLTQGAFADKIGISRQSVTLYEREARIPDIEVLSKMAAFFGVTSDYLIGLEDYRVRKDMSKAVQMAKEMRENVVFTPTVFGGGDTVIVTKEAWLMIADAVEGKI